MGCSWLPTTTQEEAEGSPVSALWWWWSLWRWCEEKKRISSPSYSVRSGMPQPALPPFPSSPLWHASFPSARVPMARQRRRRRKTAPERPARTIVRTVRCRRRTPGHPPFPRQTAVGPHSAFLVSPVWWWRAVSPPIHDTARPDARERERIRAVGDTTTPTAPPPPPQW